MLGFHHESRDPHSKGAYAHLGLETQRQWSVLAIAWRQQPLVAYLDKAFGQHMLICLAACGST